MSVFLETQKYLSLVLRHRGAGSLDCLGTSSSLNYYAFESACHLVERVSTTTRRGKGTA